MRGEPQPVPQVERPAQLVAAELPGAHLGYEGVRHEPGVIGQLDRVGRRAVGAVEEQQEDRRGVLRVEREIGAVLLQRGAQEVRFPRGDRPRCRVAQFRPLRDPFASGMQHSRKPEPRESRGPTWILPSLERRRERVTRNRSPRVWPSSAGPLRDSG